jgi:manganese/iron transport system substrate-binding protein
MKQRRGKPRFWLGLVLLISAVVGACGPTPEVVPPSGIPELKPVALSAGEKLNVVATTNIVGDVVHQVGGDRIALTTLMGTGVEPHSWVPTPANMAAIHDAHVLFVNGAGLETNLDKILQNSGGNAVVVSLSQGIANLLPEGTSVASVAKPGRQQEAIDPHVWFDVRNVIAWVKTIEQTLSALDPANAETYRANAEAYTQQLKELDAWVGEQVATIPEANRKLVTNHPAFGYLAKRYGLQQVGAVYPISPSSEPSAQDIAVLEDAIRQHGVPAVFTESTVNPNLAEQVAKDTGVKLVSLYTDSLGGPGSGAESYVDVIHYDITAIVDALR